MENPAFSKFLASPLFTIVSEAAGEERKEYTIHSALLASMSPALKRLVDGDMMEANERRVSWDTDNQTLALFCEFAYTGNYKVVKKSEVKSSVRQPGTKQEDMEDVKTERSCTLTQGSEQEDEENDRDYEDEPASETTSIYNEEHECPEDIADDLYFSPSNPQDEIDNDFLAQACIAHARILNLADYHGVSSLIGLSSARLNKHLERMEGHSHYAVTRLLESTPYFAEDVEDSVACHIGDCIGGLWLHEPLREAVEKRPQLMAGIIMVISVQIRRLNSEVDMLERR